MFGDLYRVQRRPLAQIVRYHPEREPVLDAVIGAQPAHIDLVFAGAFGGRHIAFIGGTIEQHNARGFAHRGAGFVGGGSGASASAAASAHASAQVAASIAFRGGYKGGGHGGGKGGHWGGHHGGGKGH